VAMCARSQGRAVGTDPALGRRMATIDPSLLDAVVGGEQLKLAKHVSDEEFIKGEPPTMLGSFGNACIRAFRALSPAEGPPNPPTGALGIRG
jgi:hypothetical protein